MWALLSSRLRTWLLFALLVPVVRRIVRVLADRRERSAPNARTTKALRGADRSVTRLEDRRTRGRRGKR